MSYQIQFNSAEKQYLLTNPMETENIVISIELNSGQEMKSVLPDELSNRLQGKTGGSIDTAVTETSSLSVALLSLEMANKLGVPEDQFKLGEEKYRFG